MGVDRYRRLRESCKARGICTVCRKEPARPTQIKCEACATKQVRYMKALVGKRIERGECRTCGIKLDPSIKMIRCPVCQEAAREIIYFGRKL